MVMGGLITDGAGYSTSGLPFASRIPVFGALFGNQGVNHDRTELVLFVTPRLVETASDHRGVIDDLRRKMERLGSAYPAVKPAGAPQVPPAPPVFVAPW
jgi:general secretion pathway protein D